MIKIISDSSTLYSVKEGAKRNIAIAPLTVTINNKTYREHEDIGTREFIEIINQGHLPLSSQPSIGEVIELYKQYGEDEIINITMADGLSGTYNSACAAREMDNDPSRIDVINSGTLCGPEQYLVNLAVKLVDEGKRRNEIVQTINKVKDTAKSYLIPLDYDYLVRGGRLSPLVGKIGSIIKLVPVMVSSADGKCIEKLTTKRTFKKAIQAICESMDKDGVDQNYRVYISHAHNEELADEAERIIGEHIAGIEIVKNVLGPAFTTQGGPGCIAIQRVKKYECFE